jgi:hypothetical protein
VNLRPITALALPDVARGGADRARPEYAEVDPTTLFVDDEYQRSLSRQSLRLIRRLVAQWDWRAYKPPNVCRVGDALHVVDGQHTAIAAASHPAVGKIPVFIVDAPAAADRAGAFIKLNRDRVAITPLQLFHAELNSGDATATAIAAVCSAAGVKILKHPAGMRHRPEVGETRAIGVIRNIFARRRSEGLRRVCELAVAAGRAPVDAPTLRALEAVLFDRHALAGLPPARIAQILKQRMNEVFTHANRYAMVHKTPTWHGIVDAIATFSGKAQKPVPAFGAKASAGGRSKVSPATVDDAPARRQGQWTSVEDERVANLHDRGRGLTEIAALMRRPYRDVEQSLARQGLKR